MKVIKVASNLTLFVVVALGVTQSALSNEERSPGNATYTRQATFKLTFRNSDLTWIGDPASPNALAYPRKGCQANRNRFLCDDDCRKP